MTDRSPGYPIFMLSRPLTRAVNLMKSIFRLYNQFRDALCVYRLIGPLPSNMTQIAGVERVDGNEFHLRDGTKVTGVDSFIYCTGYKYSFPFLDDRCEITVDDNYVSPLYKHLVNVEHPSMSIVGIPMTVIPFALFHMQVIKFFIQSFARF